MKPRICGLETEFGILPLDESKDKEMFELLVERLDKKVFLENGGLAYVDTMNRNYPVEISTATHPEYATPEVLLPEGLKELIDYDKAGELLITGRLPEFKFFKNNEDEEIVADRARFGCHENYLLYREYGMAFARLGPFFVARQLLHGNGSIVDEEYHLSQRAKFLHIPFTSMGFDIFNVHIRSGEPLSGNYGRMHVYFSDSNLCELSNYLKVGLAALMIDLLEKNALPDIILCEPTKYLSEYSIPFNKMQEFKFNVLLGGRRIKMNAFEMLEPYLEAAEKYCSKDATTKDVLERTQYALKCLRNDPMQLQGWLDYIEKKRLLDGFTQAEKLELEDDRVKAVAMQYHDIDRRQGLYYALQEQGKIERMITSGDVIKAISNPPGNTRAWLRGNVMKRWGEKVRKVDWTAMRIALGYQGTPTARQEIIHLDDPFNNYHGKLLELEAML